MCRTFLVYLHKNYRFNAQQKDSPRELFSLKEYKTPLAIFGEYLGEKQVG